MPSSPKPSASRRRGSSPARPAGELALIERIRQRAANFSKSPELSVGIGDDCAILRPQPGEELVVTTDFCLEDRHWSRAWNPPQSIGHRTLARGLSDLAAMGARPAAAFLSLALPAETARDTPWIEGFLDGLLTLAAASSIPLAGGDTSESPSSHVLADIVCLGAAPRGTALRRSGARPGDLLYCTGTLGGSFAQRTLLSTAPVSAKKLVSSTTQPFLYPQPRLHAGQALRERGLASAEASRAGAEINLSSLPASPWLRHLAPEQRLDAMLHGGEDYELLFTAPPSSHIPGRLAGTRITRIGLITPRPRSGPALFSTGSTGHHPLMSRGWEHLR